MGGSRSELCQAWSEVNLLPPGEKTEGDGGSRRFGPNQLGYSCHAATQVPTARPALVRPALIGAGKGYASTSPGGKYEGRPSRSPDRSQRNVAERTVWSGPNGARTAAIRACAYAAIH